MDKERQNSVYVNMMIDTLRRKESILTVLYQQTQEQERLLKSEELDIDEFNELLEKKGSQIDELNELDEGFDALFQKVEKEIVANREAYRDDIKKMQRQIIAVSELGVKIQTLEHQNSTRLEAFLAEQRKSIRHFNLNNKTASSYYKNMANAHKPEQSYFFNETK